MEATFEATRINRHGKIASLAENFNIESKYNRSEYQDGVPFSIFVKAKADTDVTSITASVKLMNDEAYSDCPIVLEAWTECAIKSIEANAIDLDVYDVFWGAAK